MNPIEHGTNGGYQACKKLLGTACDRCKKAEADYMKEWRKKNGEAAKRLKEKAQLRQKAKTILANHYYSEFQFILAELEREAETKSGHPESGQSETSET